MATNETLQECGHVALWRGRLVAPRLGDNIYCPVCEDMRRVLAIPGSWYAQCENCRWNCQRMREETVFDNCVQHLKRNDNHSILLRDYNGKIHVVTLRVIESEQTLI